MKGALVKQDTAKVNWRYVLGARGSGLGTRFFMSNAPGLKVSLKRGALVAAANWPLIVVQFVAEATLKLLLAVPVIGGIVLVVLLLDGDVAELLSGDVSEIVARVTRSLAASPLAGIAFLIAFFLVLIVGSALTFVVKGGTVAILAEAETIVHDAL